MESCSPMLFAVKYSKITGEEFHNFLSRWGLGWYYLLTYWHKDIYFALTQLNWLEIRTKVAKTFSVWPMDKKNINFFLLIFFSFTKKNHLFCINRSKYLCNKFQRNQGSCSEIELGGLNDALVRDHYIPDKAWEIPNSFLVLIISHGLFGELQVS